MSDVLETNVSRDVFRRHTEERTPMLDHEPPWGMVYTCPRCGWKSPGMFRRFGAECQGQAHALVCKPR